MATKGYCALYKFQLLTFADASLVSGRALQFPFFPTMSTMEVDAQAKPATSGPVPTVSAEFKLLTCILCN